MSRLREPGEVGYAGRTVVVTGAFGYLGSALSRRLRDLGAVVRGSTRGRRESTGEVDAWTGDLADSRFCRQLVQGADVVFHLAGQTSVPVARQEPLADLRANVQTTLTLLEACRTRACRVPFVYAGTATQVGYTADTIPGEHRADQPITVYDADKLAAEHLIGVYTTDGVVDGLTLRLANVYGPGESESAADRGITNKMVTRALSGECLAYYGDGACVRDYVYVDDVIEAFLKSALVARYARRRSYVVGGGQGYKLCEVFELVARITSELGLPRVEVMSVPWPEETHTIDRRSYVADIAPLAGFCGWQPTIDLPEGIRLSVLAEHRSTHRDGQPRIPRVLRRPRVP